MIALLENAKSLDLSENEKELLYLYKIRITSFISFYKTSKRR